MCATVSIPNSVNADLKRERDRATFKVEEFSMWWHGGAEKLALNKELDEFLFRETVDDLRYEHLSGVEFYEQTIKDGVSLVVKLREFEQMKNPTKRPNIIQSILYMPRTLAYAPHYSPLVMSFLMFIKAIETQGTKEQYEYFGRMAEDCKIFGTYAQTELGHGTNINGIETRADFNRQTQEFIMNTPTLSAYKFWAAALGQTVNHCIVVAKLFIENEERGVQMFIVPIRNTETHEPLSGIDVGEVGKKIGVAGGNQGYLCLTNVRIPRMNMLMKYAKVLPDGTFQSSPVSQLSYMTMVFTRCWAIEMNNHMLAGAVTIATRYSAVRRQGQIKCGLPEPQIIDFQTQQLKLFSKIATTIAFRICIDFLWQKYEYTLKAIESSNFSALLELHIQVCVFKALCTNDAAFGIESLRLSCGGHGYLSSANLGHLYANAVAACTYEGENTVLLLQVGRFLVKTWKRMMRGEKVPPSVEYFVEAYALIQPPKWNESWEWMVIALKFSAAGKTRRAFEHLLRYEAAGLTEQEALNETSIELREAAELHGHVMISQTFLEAIIGLNVSAALKEVLENILHLYLLLTFQRCIGDILQFISLTEVHVAFFQKQLESALARLRPNAVAICDGFNYHDRFLNSVLGAYDGNIYERIMNTGKRSPLNQISVPKTFQTHLKPFMQSKL